MRCETDHKLHVEIHFRSQKQLFERQICRLIERFVSDEDIKFSGQIFDLHTSHVHVCCCPRQVLIHRRVSMMKADDI